MKRQTIDILVYDNDSDDCDGRVEIRTKTVKDSFGLYIEYVIHMGDTTLAATQREFLELYKLMNEVVNDGKA